MTQTTHSPSSPFAERLRDARAQAGMTLDAASAATGLLRSYLAAVEDGRRRPLPAEVDRLSTAYGADLSELYPPRRPVEIDAATGRIGLDGRERHVPDAADERAVYAAYLFLLYAVRGAAPGERIALRSSDVELLVQVVGDDPATIERRLVQLMGCTPAEATMLGSVLVRHRALTAAVGATAALSWAAVVAPGAPAAPPRPAQVGVSAQASLSGGTSSAAYYDLDAVEGGLPSDTDEPPASLDELPVSGAGEFSGVVAPSYADVATGG